MCLLPPTINQSLLDANSSANPAQTVTAAKVPPAIAIQGHITWARAIARGVRNSFRFLPGSQEEQDLESTAYLAAVELAQRFDPTRVPPGGDLEAAFRGWATIAVRSHCRREARRLRNGGTYHTRREKPGHALVVQGLPEHDDVMLVDPRSVEEEEGEEADC